MALSYDTSVNFNAAGLICEGGACPSANIEFTGGGARIKPATASGTFTLVAPSIDTTAWAGAPQPIYSAEVTATEAAGYYHKFAVSFDGLTTLSLYDERGWTAYDPVDLGALMVSNPVEYGMSLAEFNAIREWPAAADVTNMFLVVAMTKAVGGGNGLIDQWTVAYGTTEFAVTGEPDGSDALVNDATNPFYCPDYPLKRSVEWDFVSHETEMGYKSYKNRASLPRSTYECEWRNRTETHADNIQAFLVAHQDAAFVWTPPGFGSSKKWIALEPTITREDSGVYTVRASLVEVLPI